MSAGCSANPIVCWRGALYPLRSLATSVLIHFGPFYKDRTDKGPKWQRTEVDVQIGTKDHVVRCGIIRSCQSAATSEIVKRF